MVAAVAGSVPAEGTGDAEPDDPTIAIYDAHAAEWSARREPQGDDLARALGAAVTSGGRGPAVDLGCGPGWNLAALDAPGRRAVALDASRGMLAEVVARAPGAPRVCASLAALPFRAGALGGAWASRSYVHLARADVPLALGDLHRALAPDGPMVLRVFGGDLEHGTHAADRFVGRRFSHWPTELLRDVVVGAGFEIEGIDEQPGPHLPLVTVHARRTVSLPDTVGSDMRLLVCGLNPSPAAAAAGVGFFRAGNRFWPAALTAGLVSRDRDPLHALRHHGIGMTDLVKRTTARADELDREEYRAGIDRLDRLCAWLEPGAVCLVGLAGWRAAVDRRAVAGPQERTLGGRPVHLMPSTSGLNAGTGLDELVDHLRAAARLAA